MPALKMVRLTTAGDAFEARVLAARLGAEGIVWELRGAVDGPLALGVVDVLVDADDLDTARELLLVDEVDDALCAVHVDVDTPRRTTARDVLVLTVVLVGVFAFALARMTARV